MRTHGKKIKVFEQGSNTPYTVITVDTKEQATYIAARVNAVAQFLNIVATQYSDTSAARNSKMHDSGPPVEWGGSSVNSPSPVRSNSGDDDGGIKIDWGDLNLSEAPHSTNLGARVGSTAAYSQQASPERRLSSTSTEFEADVQRLLLSPSPAVAQPHAAVPYTISAQSSRFCDNAVTSTGKRMYVRVLRCTSCLCALCVLFYSGGFLCPELPSYYVL